MRASSMRGPTIRLASTIGRRVGQCCIQLRQQHDASADSSHASTCRSAVPEPSGGIADPRMRRDREQFVQARPRNLPCGLPSASSLPTSSLLSTTPNQASNSYFPFSQCYLERAALNRWPCPTAQSPLPLDPLLSINIYPRMHIIQPSLNISAPNSSCFNRLFFLDSVTAARCRLNPISRYCALPPAYDHRARSSALAPHHFTNSSPLNVARPSRSTPYPSASRSRDQTYFRVVLPVSNYDTSPSRVPPPSYQLKRRLQLWPLVTSPRDASAPPRRSDTASLLASRMAAMRSNKLQGGDLEITFGRHVCRRDRDDQRIRTNPTRVRRHHGEIPRRGDRDFRAQQAPGEHDRRSGPSAPWSTCTARPIRPPPRSTSSSMASRGWSTSRRAATTSISSTCAATASRRGRRR